MLAYHGRAMRSLPAVAVLAYPQLAAHMSLGPLQVPGSASTPRAATWRPGDFRQTRLPSKS